MFFADPAEGVILVQPATEWGRLDLMVVAKNAGMYAKGGERSLTSLAQLNIEA